MAASGSGRDEGGDGGEGSGRAGPVTLFLAGDVMIGRGLDQVLPTSVPPALREPHVEDARRYVELAERENGPIPAPASPEYPWGDALDPLDRAETDARIVNLETALTTSDDAWPGKAIHYRSHPANVGCLAAAGIDVAVLANNHALDWGRAGLRETLETLRRAGMRPAGAGAGREEARAPAAVELDGGEGRVLVFALASATAGVPAAWAAGEEGFGVALLPELSGGAARRAGRRLERARREGDVAVASLHWGPNWGYGITPEQRRFARLLVEEGGFDLVHGHSSHHPKGLEIHDGRLILYGCGDFLNDYEGIAGHEQFRPELTIMYLPFLEAGTGRLERLEMIPLRIRRFRLERTGDEAARWLRDTLREESRRLDGTDRIDPELGDDGRLLLRP